MSQPFPTDPALRKATAVAMQAAAPALMAEIADWRKLFPGARLTCFQAGEIDLGVASPLGWEPDENLMRHVAYQHAQATRKTDEDAIIAKRDAKKRGNVVKRLKGRKT